VYLACLSLGVTNVTKLANKAQIKRTTTYDILKSLLERGLVGSTRKGNKNLYYAEDPEKLNILLEEKKNRLMSAMPALKELFNHSEARPKVKYYEGLEGLKNVYRDTLTCQSTLVAFVTENILKHLGKDFADEYKQKRTKQKIFVRVIGPDTSEIREYKKSDSQDLKKTLLVPQKEFPFSIEMNIYEKKVAYMSFKEEMGVIIESSEIAKNMKLLFELAWKGAKVK